MIKEKKQEPIIEHIHMINSDEVFGAVIEETDNGILINNPLCVVEADNGEGYTNLAFVSYLPFSLEKKIFIKNEHILLRSRVTPEMNMFYALSSYFVVKGNIQQRAVMEETNNIMSNVIMNEMGAEKYSNNGHLMKATLTKH